MRKFAVILILAAITVSLCGCDMWMDGTYYSVTPHRENNTGESLEAVEVTGFAQMQSAIEEMVSSGRESGVMYVSGLEVNRLDTFMNMAVNNVTTWDAVGAYAVESISYEVGNNAGRTAVAIDITYNRSRSDILRIKHTQNMDEARAEILTALEKCEAGVVLLVDGYTATDFVQLVQDFGDMNPDKCMELPQVTASVYPESGSERVVELSFTYQTSRETLRIMQNYVLPIFEAAVLNVSGEEGESAKFSMMYSFLMERNDYRVETSLTPAYSLLRHGVGDSKAFAVVYSAMCREAGLDCQIVSGTRDGSPWVWNMICEDGVYYYVDLLRSEANSTFVRMTEANMPGYVWDYSAYPEAGPKYQPAIEPEPVEQSTEAPTEATQATEPEVTEPTETEPAETAPTEAEMP